MLDLEVIPERALASAERNWEFILGKKYSPPHFTCILQCFFFLCLYQNININLTFFRHDARAGMHFSQAVAIIQSQVGTIKNVNVLYSEQVSFPNFSSVFPSTKMKKQYSHSKQK